MSPDFIKQIGKILYKYRKHTKFTKGIEPTWVFKFAKEILDKARPKYKYLTILHGHTERYGQNSIWKHKPT